MKTLKQLRLDSEPAEDTTAMCSFSLLLQLFWQRPQSQWMNKLAQFDQLLFPFFNHRKFVCIYETRKTAVNRLRILCYSYSSSV